MSALSHQTLLVTGASGRLGQGVVRHLLDTLGVPPGRIVATMRRPERLSAIAVRGIELRRRGRAQRIHDVHWLADRGALFTLLKSLLENAVQHMSPGTQVRVEVDTVSVRDWGPGVDAEQLPQIFTRFWRGLHRSDQGAGLDLAICREIALAHGWTLSAHRENPGLQLCLTVPVVEGQVRPVLPR